MKTLRLSFIVLLASLIVSSGCQRNGREDILVPEKANVEKRSTEAVVSNSMSARGPAVCNPYAYIITLESKTLVNGNWEWTWSVQNSNPGNGGGGTFQDLSHWGMQFGSCFIWSSVVSAAYSGNGTTWISFTPVYQVDPSQNCMTTPVLKFDFGTNGSAKSYYKLVVSQNYPVGWVPGYYKSGANTGCCTFNFTGIGCPGGGIEE
jgi:hypothetical protein